jgi:hypothetical protein
MWLRLFSAYRELDDRSQTQAEAMESEVREHAQCRADLDTARADLDRERVRRIAAETVAVERAKELDRVIQMCSNYREDLARVNAERLKSLDALNVKLMRESAPEPPPDMEKYRTQGTGEDRSTQVRKVMEAHRKMDLAILSQLHPAFKGRFNQPTQLEEAS